MVGKGYRALKMQVGRPGLDLCGRFGNKLADAILLGREEGMQDFAMSLKKLVDDRLIDRNTAFSVAPNQDALKMALKGIHVRAPGIL